MHDVNAYHEAAHAVLARRLGAEVLRLVAAGDGELLGARWSGCCWRSPIDDPRARALVAWGGMMGARLATGAGWPRLDYETAIIEIVNFRCANREAGSSGPELGDRLTPRPAQAAEVPRLAPPAAALLGREADLVAISEASAGHPDGHEIGWQVWQAEALEMTRANLNEIATLAGRLRSAGGVLEGAALAEALREVGV